LSSRLILYIAAGGAAGGLARWALGVWVSGWAGTPFPVATLGVNVAGAFLLGIFATTLPRARLSAEAKALLTVGLCGGFTTFSTFALETVELLGRGAHGSAGIYVLLTAAVGPLAIAAGATLACAALRRIR